MEEWRVNRAEQRSDLNAVQIEVEGRVIYIESRLSGASAGEFNALVLGLQRDFNVPSADTLLDYFR